MELKSGEDLGIVKVGSGLALVILCLGISFNCTLNRSLIRVRASANCAFLVVKDLDSVIDGLDRVRLSQQRFLETGDKHFSEDVAENITRIQWHIDSLQQIAAGSNRLRVPAAKLIRAVYSALRTVGKSDDIRRSEGSAAAIALLDKDSSIDEAMDEAGKLRMLARIIHKV